MECLIGKPKVWGLQSRGAGAGEEGNSPPGTNYAILGHYLCERFAVLTDSLSGLTWTLSSALARLAPPPPPPAPPSHSPPHSLLSLSISICPPPLPSLFPFHLAFLPALRCLAVRVYHSVSYTGTAEGWEMAERSRSKSGSKAAFGRLRPLRDGRREGPVASPRL